MALTVSIILPSLTCTITHSEIMDQLQENTPVPVWKGRKSIVLLVPDRKKDLIEIQHPYVMV